MVHLLHLERFGNGGGILKFTYEESRKQKLTTSTFIAAIGFWRRQSFQLRLEKIGAIEPFSGNHATCWSNIKEVEALERYKLIMRLAASSDGIIKRLVYELPSRRVLEFLQIAKPDDDHTWNHINSVPLNFIKGRGPISACKFCLHILAYKVFILKLNLGEISTCAMPS
ncbi:hypothetical protein TSUD_34570 [Trifolium subterraneum]|uniref:Uncharacterized protein n=1 Tax=Trifolium subterraneum TaxID=3900 RepID=A0A2Z6P6N7_TRISU|nr:hypothetical protein TSUD_34570 [Trifolium subterraneum]